MAITSSDPSIAALTPREIVAQLDRYIVGQAKAKRAVAIAMRNRYRRERISGEMRGEIIPKNILMIGPTGVGKTEIARRLAALAGAPFVKVEATKYTEVGYVGRDVESMVRDLVEASVRMVQEERRGDVAEGADKQAIERVIDLLFPETCPPQPQGPAQANPFGAALGSIFGNNFPQQNPMTPAQSAASKQDPNSAAIREQARAEIARGFYDVRLLDIEIEESRADADRHDGRDGSERRGRRYERDVRRSLAEEEDAQARDGRRKRGGSSQPKRRRS